MPDVTFDEVSLYRICFTVEGTVRKNARTRFTSRGGKVRAHNSKKARRARASGVPQVGARVDHLRSVARDDR